MSRVSNAACVHSVMCFRDQRCEQRGKKGISVNVGGAAGRTACGVEITGREM